MLNMTDKALISALIADGRAEPILLGLHAALRHAAHQGDDCIQASIDNLAVIDLAEKMKDKLAAARSKGRSGWDDPARCDVDYLAKLFLEQLRKPTVDLVDVANFAMMLHHRPGGQEALRANIAQAMGVRPSD